MSKWIRATRSAVARTEELESRTLFAFFQVTTVADAGPGSLRQAILDANASAEPDRLIFQVPHGSVFHPQSPLPEVSGRTAMESFFGDGPAYGIDGADAGATADGLVFAPGAGGSTLQGFAVYGFGGSGVVTSGLSNFGEGLTITLCNIGTDVAGTATDRGNGRNVPGSAGIKVFNAPLQLGTIPAGGTGPIAAGIIAYNVGDGVQLNNGNASVSGAYVHDNTGWGITGGVTLAGPDSLFRNRLSTQVSRNGAGGIRVGGGTIIGATIDHNGGGGGVLVNGAITMYNSAIVGNAGGGITIEGPGSAGNRIYGNNVSGNSRWGVGLFSGAHDNFFGGSRANPRDPSAANVITGNGTPGDSKSRASGVVISGAGTNRNQFLSNIIDANTENGVEISDGASSNLFTTLTTLDPATMSGNARNGVLITGANTRYNAFYKVTITGNGAMPIDLVTPPDGPVGPNPNDPLDADVGANDLLNHPVLRDVSPRGAADGISTITGSIDTKPLTEVDIQLYTYRLPQGDPGPGGPQLGRYLTSVHVVTGAGANGHADFSVQVGGATGIRGLEADEYVTSIATVRQSDTEPTMVNFPADTSEASPGVRADPFATVSQIYLNSSHWTQKFRNYLAASQQGSPVDGYALFPNYNPQGPGEIVWTNVDEVAVRFSEDVNVTRDDLRVAGGGVYDIADFHYDPTTFTATWRLTRAVSATQLDLLVSDDVTARDDGTDLDGDGNAQAGGEFHRTVLFVPGDAVRDGRLNALDLASIRQHLNADAASSTGPGYDPLKDLDGSGRIDALDLAAFRRAQAAQSPIAASLFGEEPIL